MDDVNRLWRWWQSLLVGFGVVFTRPGWVRFVQWVTGTVLCWEEHTITQILVAMGLSDRWRVLEHFAEYGAWDRQGVERQLIRLIEQEQPARCAAYHPVALDDTKLHRTSADVWGTCTFHESTARSPNRATTVRAHNWVVMGDLVPGQPWTYLPHSARLYFRQSQLPIGETFRKKTQLAGALLQQVDDESAAPILAVFDGAYANETVIGPCLRPPLGRRRIEVLTRLRLDARLYRAVVVRPGRPGPKPKWGQRLPAPKDHERWEGKWRSGRAYIYGRMRRFRYKRLECYWAVAGPDELVHAYIFYVEGYKDPWYAVTTARDLTPEQVVALYPARYRQENGFREHKQLFGMEECRAWTKEPVLRTFQVQMVAMTLLRLIQVRLDERSGDAWWEKPEWNRGKSHPSLLDLRRLMWQHREAIAQLLVELEDFENSAPNLPRRRKTGAEAA